MADLIGTCLNDRYRLDAELGRGGMGVVYRAYDTLLERDVAVKVLYAATWGTEGRARLLREARAVAQLNHPHIVSVYDAGEAAGTPFIVMELVEGESLHQRRPPDLAASCAIAAQVCSALEHAHAQGIVHRDLKPENVMLTLNGTAKLMDFGLARSAASRLTAEDAIVGTWAYIAPEQALGREVDARADLYALGVMLYELTTGQLPFTADDPVLLISQHVHAPVVPPRARNDQVPPALNNLIVRLLSKDPADRPASATAVRQELARPEFLESGLLSVPEPAGLERIERERLVGRAEELRQARALWTAARAGQGQVLLISGEPGIGKSRLVRELVTQAQVQGGGALVGASYAQGGRPYDAFRQIIRTVLRDGSGLELPEPVLADLLTLTPELRPRYPDMPPNPPLDPAEEQQRLFEHLLVLVAALSELAPLLLVLEDVHWADSGTLALLRHLTRHTGQQRVLLVATYREVELTRPLQEVLLDLQRERLATRLKLSRLDQAQTGALLAVLLAEEITPEFLEGIYRETEGNPFFVEEVCKALVESGQLTYQDGHWQRPSMAELGIPQSVRVAIQARVGALSAAAQVALQVAAVLGREFDLGTLTAASDQDEDELVEALEDAERAQLIAAVPGTRGESWAFAHALIPTALVEELRAGERRRLHLRVAQALEARRPDDVEALAYHYSQTREAEKAAHYLLLAGDQARLQYAHPEAIANYRQGLELLQEAGDLERAARTAMKLGLAYHNALDFHQARQAYEQGFALWQRADRVIPETARQPAPHALRMFSMRTATLDPTLVNDMTSGNQIFQLFSGLVEPSPELNIVPDVAHTWEVLEGGCKYIFYLRDDVRWSDGVLVTAQDFVYAWRRKLDPAINSSNASVLYDIKGARAFHQGQERGPNQLGLRALDASTLEVELENPAGYFLYLLAQPFCYPIPRHVVERHGAAWTQPQNIVTNGPFTVESWNQAQIVTLVRNPRYHGQDRCRGNVQRVERHILADESAMLEMYEAGALDIIPLWRLGSPARERARQKHAADYVAGPTINVEYVAFDVQRPPFDDVRVRRALVLAVDRETLANVILKGFAIPATGGFVPPGMPGHSPGIGLPYDPEQAQRLLAEAGYPGGRGFPHLDCPVRRGHQDQYEYLQAQWEQNLGVESVWQATELATFGEQVRRDLPQLFASGWVADYPDPNNFLREAIPWGQTGWQNPTYDRLVAQAGQSTDQQKRLDLYKQADRILIQEAVIMPLIHLGTHLLMKPWIRRYPLSPLQLRAWKDVVIEPH